MAVSESLVAQLFKSQGRRMRSFLRRRLRSNEDAQDAAQDVFLRLLRRERAGTLDSDARSYMVKAAHNVAVDVERWRAYHKPDGHVALEDETAVSEDVEASEQLYWREGLRRFVDALNGLPHRTQQVFVLYHVEGRPHAAIARRLGMSLRSVERHMARAIAHCEAQLKDYLR